MSRRSWMRSWKLLAPLGLVAVWACYDAPVETPVNKVTQETDVRVEQNIKNQVDILFMVDNSPSMTPKQNALKAQFPQLIKILDQFGQMNPAWYHIGVVTSDLGVNNGQLFGCPQPGQNGQLQAMGAAAPAGCMPPTGGVNYIDYNQLMPDANGNATSNLPAGQDLPTTFNCMADVGDTGCGFEHQLESVYRALHDKPAANQGFLRDDALLVVVWVTDEDDCSADPSTDLFDPSKTGAPPNGYGALASYRCSEFGIQCNGSLMPYGDSGGALMNCISAPNPNGMGPGKLIDINKYINFFTKPAGQGGVKVDPSDVILFDITAPEMPVESILAQAPPPAGPYVQCSGPISSSCAVVLQHSCIAPTDNNFFGDPAVRIRGVVDQAAHHQDTSICDTSYQSALQSLGQLIVSNIGAGCITSPFEDPTKPDCVVEDITSNMDGTTTVTEIPWCGANHENPPTCWELQQNPKCDVVCASPGAPGQQYGVKIDRGSGGIPPNTTARVACSTLAIPKTDGGTFACGPVM